MSDIKPIKRALVSVFHKEGLDEILALLNAGGVKFLSTGGTRSFIESLGYECEAVEDLTLNQLRLIFLTTVAPPRSCVSSA